MKRPFYFISMLFALACISSCLQEKIFEDESDKNLSLTNYNFVCPSKNRCLPVVDINGLNRIANVYLSCTDYNNDHQFTFRCWDESGMTYKEENFLSANSSFTFGFPPASTNTGYTVSYNLACRKCSECRISGVIRINADGVIKAGSLYDCFKDYLNYTVRLDYEYSNSVIIETQAFNNFNDTEHYMDINKMRVYIIDSYGNEKLYTNSYIKLLSPYSFKISGLPTNNSLSNMKSCRVELYNDKCKGNFEHYLFFTYTSYGEIRLNQYSLDTYKGH